jgi:DNA polymerase-3 subunit alpha
MADSDLNKRTLESLIKCGAFDSLGVTRSSLLSCYESIVDSELESKHSNVAGQFDLFSIGFGDETPAPPSYQYPSVPEFSLRELLVLEKESSGMYFSGHMADNYSRHISSLHVDRISDILNAFSDDGDVAESKYKDKSSVKIAGIITAKRTKVTKNGSTMAYLTVEDRLGEISVVVFAKQYAALYTELYTDNAVYITGTISAEEGEDPEILLTTAERLTSNSDYVESSPVETVKKSSVYIRVANMKDERIPLIYRISALNRGQAQILLFDDSTRKTMAMRNILVDPSDKVIKKLKDIFGEKDVVLR